jgi:hypothetical protein
VINENFKPSQPGVSGSLAGRRKARETVPAKVPDDPPFNGSGLGITPIPCEKDGYRG